METRRKLTVAGVSLAAVIAGGALTAAAIPAVAVTESPTSSETRPDRGPHEANGITEEELTGDVAEQVEAAVLAEYPDATIERMETDADGAAYEAHITQADGTRATVKLDESFAITGTETGGPGGGHRGGGPREGEEELTGDIADQVEAAVLEEYPDATIDRMETDADGATYEAHITQADGTRLTVKLDESFAITGTEEGRTGGGPRGDRPGRDGFDDSGSDDTDTDDTDNGTDPDTETGAAS
ncbi:hypothetical protein [Naasia sp. SYSU D00948]|uniref:hypothetical protein n=1 Tax=Naasia sp. SYSU D00948 TaxID=2817379 RepID=UPI001B317D32|nr:hypothetical protein [Naasia sp. SYSU D00948]